MTNFSAALPVPAVEQLDQPLYGAGPVVAVSRFYRKYATFSGRAGRAEYWWVALFLMLVYGLIGGFAMFVGFSTGTTDSLGKVQPGPAFLPMALVVVIVGLVSAVPSIALTVRRLHDANFSGWLYLINFVPYLGGLVLVVFTFLPPNASGARFDDPARRHYSPDAAPTA